MGLPPKWLVGLIIRQERTQKQPEQRIQKEMNTQHNNRTKAGKQESGKAEKQKS